MWLEIGFGGGEHARALAAASPGAGLIAAEVFEQGLCSMLAAFVAEGEEYRATPPPNLRLWDGDARALLRALPEGALDAAFLMFPDPWPKARHAKRRFVHPDGVALLARAMASGAEWRIASDDPVYQVWVETIMEKRKDFRPDGVWQTRPEGWPGTRYEAKALEAGRAPRYWRFRRA